MRPFVIACIEILTRQEIIIPQTGSEIVALTHALELGDAAKELEQELLASNTAGWLTEPATGEPRAIVARPVKPLPVRGLTRLVDRPACQRQQEFAELFTLC